MKRSLLFAIFASFFLFGLLLIPLDGVIDNTYVFFFGRFHPLILHLPIGALVVLALMELVNAVFEKIDLEAACKLILWFSVVTILPTTLLGFMLASNGSYDDELVNTHKWLGWLTALVCVWLVVIRNKKTAPNSSGVTSFYKIFLVVNVVFLTLAGHYGGYLTHGEDYLIQYMPPPMKSVLNIQEEAEYLVINSESDPTSKEAVYYKDQIQPILETYCYECHGEKKQKGEMRLDKLHWDMTNGSDAERWHAALNVINLGEMPPKKKQQLSDTERRAVVSWISKNLDLAAKAKQKDNQNVIRRLTKKQYTNTLNELLQVSVNFGEVLPDDGKSKMGFSNNGNILQTSALHIDYYQKIAREALDKAIFTEAKPKSKRYKVSLGKQLGDGSTGAEFGGYQTAAVDNEDLIVNILDAQGNPVTNSSNQELINLKNSIGIGMRGSASNRYTMVDEGMMLNSALPHKEVTPKSWQGPSPNLKLLIREDFPRAGDFAFRVVAARGYNSLSVERLIDLRKQIPAKESAKAIHIKAREIKEKNGFILKKNRWLIPKEVASTVKANFSYTIPKSGIYQIDLVHPFVPDEITPSYHLKLLGSKEEGIISKRLNLDPSLRDAEEIVTPITYAYLTAGEHTASIGGKFFVGFSDLIFTPLPEDDPLPNILKAEAEIDDQKYASENPSIQVFIGSRTDDGMDYDTFGKPQEVEGEPGEFKTYEFTDRLENFPIPFGSDQVSGELANILTVGLWNNHLVKESGLKGPTLLIKSVEFEAPYYPVWPPKSHTTLFFDSPNKSNPDLYAKEVLGRFMKRAFRRKIENDELNRYVAFWDTIKNDFDRFEESIKEVMVAILCSPNFIYIAAPENSSPDEPIDPFYLASQLSYFLWNAPPDETLMQLASEGSLRKELEEQVDRMIRNPKITEMIRSFSYEWLRLDRHKTMDVNVHKYDDYTRFVKEDMLKETYAFVQYVLENNLSILNFIDSDFAMLNQNLAEFYGIEGVKGNEFRPVQLEKEAHRGGLLSQGSFLSGHSDGVQAHPIKRAVWVKEKILGDHPPPPPPNVPELDPDTPGFENLTLKEQLFLHRNKASCMDCHQKIDPYGVVFENYDAVGRYQLAVNDKTIDSKSILPDGTEIEGIQGIKDYILKLKKDNFTRSLVENLFAYALGRDVGFADEKEINYIVEQVIDDEYRFKTVIEQLVLSPSFSKKEPSWFEKIF
jgi:mono/diheme cytochrome c family protein